MLEIPIPAACARSPGQRRQSLSTHPLVEPGKHALADLQSASQITGGLIEAVVRMLAKQAWAFERSQEHGGLVLTGAAAVATGDAVGVLRTET